MNNPFNARKPIYSLPENPTDEQIQEFIRLEALETQRIEKEEEKKKEKSKTIIKSDYDYWTKLNVDKNSVPHFMSIIFENKYYDDKEKDKFLEQICIPYLTDENFRKKNEDNHIYFKLGIFMGIDAENDIDFDDGVFPKIFIPFVFKHVNNNTFIQSCY